MIKVQRESYFFFCFGACFRIDRKRSDNIGKVFGIFKSECSNNKLIAKHVFDVGVDYLESMDF